MYQPGMVRWRQAANIIDWLLVVSWKTNFLLKTRRTAEDIEAQGTFSDTKI
jgi:hypothetical protein